MAYKAGKMPSQFQMHPSALVPASPRSNVGAESVIESAANKSSGTFSMGKGQTGFMGMQQYQPLQEGVMPARLVPSDIKDGASILVNMKKSTGGKKRRTRKTLRRRRVKTLRKHSKK